MQKQTQIMDPLSCEKWDDWLCDSQEANFFHSRAWAQVLFETYRYRPVYFGTLHSNSMGSLLPLMEVKSMLTGTRGVSLPFTDVCEPLLHDGIGLDQILQDVCRHGQQHGWRWIQMRGGNCNGAQAHQRYYLHELPLNPDTEKLFLDIRSAKRRNIRKAQRQGIRIEFKNDIQSMNTYFKLHCRTRKRHGVPPQPFRFFRNIFEHVISQGQGYIVLAWHQHQVVAGSVFFHFQKKALYKFGASDMSFQHLRANDLVMWEAIRWYAEHGYEHFSFGRTSPDNVGLRRFKSDWGAQEKTINYYRYDLRQEDFVTTESSVSSPAQTVFQRLPIPALRLVGSLLYRHMG